MASILKICVKFTGISHAKTRNTCAHMCKIFKFLWSKLWPEELSTDNTIDDDNDDANNNNNNNMMENSWLHRLFGICGKWVNKTLIMAK